MSRSQDNRRRRRKAARRMRDWKLERFRPVVAALIGVTADRIPGHMRVRHAVDGLKVTIHLASRSKLRVESP